jgi:hypothetical protein
VVAVGESWFVSVRRLNMDDLVELQNPNWKTLREDSAKISTTSKF